MPAAGARSAGGFGGYGCRFTASLPVSDGEKAKQLGISRRTVFFVHTIHILYTCTFILYHICIHIFNNDIYNIYIYIFHTCDIEEPFCYIQLHIYICTYRNHIVNQVNMFYFEINMYTITFTNTYHAHICVFFF